MIKKQNFVSIYKLLDFSRQLWCLDLCDVLFYFSFVIFVMLLILIDVKGYFRLFYLKINYF